MDRPAPRGLGAVGLLPPQRRRLNAQQQQPRDIPASTQAPAKPASEVNNLVGTAAPPAAPSLPPQPTPKSADAVAAVPPIDPHVEEKLEDVPPQMPAQSFRSAALPEPATGDEIEVGSPPQQQPQREEDRLVVHPPIAQEAEQEEAEADEEEEEEDRAGDNANNIEQRAQEGRSVRPRRQPSEWWSNNAQAQPDPKRTKGKRTRQQQQQSQKVEKAGPSKRHKSESRASLVADLLGKVVQVPGKVFGVDDPLEYFIGDVVGPDPKRKHAVVLVFRDDNSRYWFPADDVRGWLKDMHTRGTILPSARDHTTDEKEASPTAQMAAEVLTQISGSVSEGGGGGKGGAAADGAVTVTQQTVTQAGEATRSEASNVGKSKEKRSNDRAKQESKKASGSESGGSSRRVLCVRKSTKPWKSSG